LILDCSPLTCDPQEVFRVIVVVVVGDRGVSCRLQASHICDPSIQRTVGTIHLVDDLSWFQLQEDGLEDDDGGGGGGIDDGGPPRTIAERVGAPDWTCEIPSTSTSRGHCGSVAPDVIWELLLLLLPQEESGAAGQECYKGPGESHRRWNVSRRLGLRRKVNVDDASDESVEGTAHGA